MSESAWIGKALLGRYQIKQLLGQGGMAEVYQGYDPNLSRTVAIKLIHPHLASDPGFLGRFEREARAIARLRHPNIVQVYDFNHEGEVYFMVMEHVGGPTLQGRMMSLADKGERLPLPEVVDVMIKLTGAIHYAHTADMVHRDLKPSNILFTNRNEPVITDFGLARILGGASYTAAGAVLGTPLYMSPEQGKGEGGNESSDIYSLGVILFEMTTGSVPFTADTPLSVMMKHSSEPLPSPLERNPSIPPLLAEVIQSALAKDPADRFKSADAMCTALSSVKMHLSTLRPAPAPAQPPQMAETTLEPAPAPPGRDASATVVEAAVPGGTQPGTARCDAPPASLPPAVAAPSIVARPAGPAQPPAPQRPAVPAEMAVEALTPPPAAAGKRSTGMIVAAIAAIGLICVAAIAVGALVAPGLLRQNAAPGPTDAVPVVTGAINTPEPTTRAVTEEPVPTAPIATIAAILPHPAPEGMVEIPAGEFIRGVNGGTDNQPERRITLKAYFIDKTEVTNQQFTEFVNATGYVTFFESIGRSINIWRLPQPGVSADSRPDHPVVFVVWDDSVAYCQWAGKRLPTEAEWEKAARGPDGHVYPWGNDFDSARANTALNPDAPGGTAPVGSFPDGASVYGVLDMSGNVWEFTNDQYSATYFATSPDVDPPGPSDGSDRVTRGGGWRNNSQLYISAVFRDHATAGSGNDMSGFRCAQDIP